MLTTTSTHGSNKRPRVSLADRSNAPPTIHSSALEPNERPSKRLRQPEQSDSEPKQNWLSKTVNFFLKGNGKRELPLSCSGLMNRRADPRCFAVRSYSSPIETTAARVQDSASSPSPDHGIHASGRPSFAAAASSIRPQLDTSSNGSCISTRTFTESLPARGQAVEVGYLRRESSGQGASTETSAAAEAPQGQTAGEAD